MIALPYRPNVGIALFNRAGLVFAGRGVSDGPEMVYPGFDWQMPQGGVDAGEDIVAAARRELQEETGVVSAELLAVADGCWRYDWPAYDGPPHWLCGFAGQEQRWVAFRFTGEDDEVDIARADDGGPIEFDAWDWAPLATLPLRVAPYKRAIYQDVARLFAPFCA